MICKINMICIKRHFINKSIRTLLQNSLREKYLQSNFLSTSILQNNSSKIFSEENKCIVQKKLSSNSVPLPRKYKAKDEARQASVLIPLCTVDGEPSVLFMVRPMTMPQHRGEVCFPGGKADENDRDIVHTALRETQEEIGLPENQVDVWAPMVAMPSRKDGMMNVMPIIGYCGELNLKSLHLNEHEVESVFTRTLVSLCSNVRSTQFRTDLNASTGYTLPVYAGGEHRIWGLTAIFVHQLLPLLVPEIYNYKLKHIR